MRSPLLCAVLGVGVLALLAAAAEDKEEQVVQTALTAGLVVELETNTREVFTLKNILRLRHFAKQTPKIIAGWVLQGSPDPDLWVSVPNLRLLTIWGIFREGENFVDLRFQL